MTTTEVTSAKVLLFGMINLNAIDGSAFFMSAMADMLTLDPNVEVDLALAVPLTRTLVIEDCLSRPNFRILDPFKEATLDAYDGPIVQGNPVTVQSAANYLAYQATRTPYDVIIIRSTEVAAALARTKPEIMPLVTLYVTGIVSPSKPVPEKTLQALREVIGTGGRLSCQTAEMADHIASLLPEQEGLRESIFICTPTVRSGSGSFDELFPARESYGRFVYTGKFAPNWIPDRIIAGFKRARITNPDITLHVAGDYFMRDPANPGFIDLTRHLLTTTAGLTWYGGITRDQSRALVSASDVGISWRSEALSDSLELSTKLLEFGALGRPCIMNRTPMHEQLFGADYPLFADSTEEFVSLLRRCASEPAMVREAARRAFEVSQAYTQGAARSRLLTLFPAPEGAHLVLDDVEGRFDAVPAALEGRGITGFSLKGSILSLELTGSPEESDETVYRRLMRVLAEREARMQTITLPGLREEAVATRPVISAAPLATPDTARVQQLEGEVRTLRQEAAAAAEAQRAGLAVKAQLDDATRRLEKLSRSKLGRLQLAYWRRRAGR